MYKDGAGEATIKNANMVATRIFKVRTAVASSGILYTVLKFCLIRCSDLKRRNYFSVERSPFYNVKEIFHGYNNYIISIELD